MDRIHHISNSLNERRLHFAICQLTFRRGLGQQDILLENGSHLQSGNPLRVQRLELRSFQEMQRTLIQIQVTPYQIKEAFNGVFSCL